jgi:hypothetical protein
MVAQMHFASELPLSKDDHVTIDDHPSTSRMNLFSSPGRMRSGAVPSNRLLPLKFSCGRTFAAKVRQVVKGPVSHTWGVIHHPIGSNPSPAAALYMYKVAVITLSNATIPFFDRV